MLHRCLLSKCSRSGEHHSRTHLTIPNEPKTSRIPSTNPKLACSPLNLKTQYVQPQLGKAQTLSSFPDQVLFLSPILISICHSLPLSCSSCHSFPPSTLYPPSSLPYPLVSLHILSLPYDYTQTIPSRSPSLVLPSISSLCTLCIPQSEYHLQYSSLWSDPVHVLSLTHPQLTHL